jgi:hypothetical protein
MKREIAIVAAVVVLGGAPAAAQTEQAQSGETVKTLADVARAEEARRKTVAKSAKVYTNADLKADFPVTQPPPTPAPADAPAPVAGTPAIDIPLGAAEPLAPPQDQTYWRNKMAEARTALERSRMFAEALQSRINALTTDFINRDDPAQKAQIEGERKAALAELERVRKDLDDQQKAVTAVEDEARKAGVPSGWLRPGA